MNKDTYVLTLTKTYVKEWGVEEAIRELIQNQKDNGSEEIQELDADSGTLFLGNKEGRLETSTLLLGVSSKQNDSTKLGEFGEGYKLALVVLLRLGAKVVIHNDNRIWRPEFRFSELYKTEVLHIDSEECSPTGGIVFEIQLDEDWGGILGGIQVPADEQYIETSRGNAYLDPVDISSGNIYVGGLFVTNIPSLKHSYDIKSSHIKLGRDRNAISDWDILYELAKLWVLLPEDELLQAIKEDIPDIKYIHYRNYDIPKNTIDTLLKGLDGCIPVHNEEHTRAVYTTYGHRTPVKQVSELVYQLTHSAVVKKKKIITISKSAFFNKHKKQFTKEMKKDWNRIK